MDRVTDSKRRSLSERLNKHFDLMGEWVAWVSRDCADREVGKKLAYELMQPCFDATSAEALLDYARNDAVKLQERINELEAEIEELRSHRMVSKEQISATAWALDAEWAAKRNFAPGVEPMPSTQAPHGGL